MLLDAHIPPWRMRDFTLAEIEAVAAERKKRADAVTPKRGAKRG
jgi:hypothetical protein